MSGAGRGRTEAGYTLIFLVVAIVVLNVAVAATLPLWSTLSQRDREEELIFRGLQYVEAIRIFQQRHGRFPVRLEELIEVEPRSIRQLWGDPMSENGEWGLLIATGRTAGPRGIRYQPFPLPGTEDEEAGEVTGPLVGVFSKSSEEAIKRFMDQGSYKEWHFSINLLLLPAAISPEASFPRLSSDAIGRPLRPGLIVPGPPIVGGASLPPPPESTEPRTRRRPR